MSRSVRPRRPRQRAVSRRMPSKSDCTAHGRRSSRWCDSVTLPHRQLLLLLIEPGETAVDDVGRTGDVLRFIRREKHRQAGNILRAAETAEGNLFSERAQLYRIVE